MNQPTDVVIYLSSRLASIFLVDAGLGHGMGPRKAWMGLRERKSAMTTACAACYIIFQFHGAPNTTQALVSIWPLVPPSRGWSSFTSASAASSNTTLARRRVGAGGWSTYGDGRMVWSQRLQWGRLPARLNTIYAVMQNLDGMREDPHGRRVSRTNT